MFPSDLCEGAAAIAARQRRIGNVHESIGTDCIARAARTDQNPGAGFVNRISVYGVAASGRGRARIVQVDAGLGAAIDRIRLRRIPIAAKIEGIEILRSAHMVRLNDRPVSSSEVGWVRHGDNCKLRTLHRIAGNGDAGRVVNQNAGRAIGRTGVNVVRHIVARD